MQTDPETIAAKLSDREKAAVLAMPVTKWHWRGRPTQEVTRLAVMGLITSRACRDNKCRILHGDSQPTKLGLAVRALLQTSEVTP